MKPDLNPEQRRAVQTLSGPLLVLAGAGSGKTRVVTYRIAELIKHRVAPNRILAVTFTNKAASEMQERIAELLGNRLKERPVVSTFHSHCVRVLRRHATKLGYPEKFAIMDRGDQEGVARDVLREIRVPTDSLRPSDLLFFISRWKTNSVLPGGAVSSASTDKEHIAALGYRRYQKKIKTAGAMDFDDLLLCTEQLFQEVPEVRRQEASLFDHLLIDEYQDTNRSQYRIVTALAGDHRNLCVVGDDDQSIYGWRGAEVEHILRFQQDWPDATVVWLEHNYRSTSAILDLANRLIAFNRLRHQKTLRATRTGGERPRILQYRDEEEEAKAVVADIRQQLLQPGFHPRDFAILFRTNEQPRAFEAELRRSKMPYVLIGGMSFYDRREVRDMLAYLRVLDQPEDEISLLRIINTPPRGISAKTVEFLMETAIARGEKIWQIMCCPELLAALPANARGAIAQFVDLIRRYQQLVQKPPLTPTLTKWLNEIGYEEELRRLYPSPEEQQSRLAAVEEIVNALANYEKRTRKPQLTEFLDESLLGDRDFNNEKDKQLRRNAIVLMTLHSAKGLEFPFVYMVGMEEGILPHHRSVAAEGDAIDEERRLCYVGITRARERLCLSLALTRMKWGKPRETVPSRFLYEITGQAEKAPTARRKRGRTQADS